MTTARTYSEFDGKLSIGTLTHRTCGKCGKQTVYLQSWESSCGGYEDYKFTCKSCGNVCWVDGIDS